VITRILMGIIFFTLILSCPIFACETPEKTLIDYLNRDFLGERLNHKSSSRIDKLETDNQFEPAWDTATLTTKYEIKSIKQEGDKAVVIVFFKNAWEIAGKGRFNPGDVKDEIVSVHMVKVNGCWKVGPPFYRPHVQVSSLMRHYKKLIQDAKKAGEDRAYIEDTKSVLDNIVMYNKSLGAH
jgi:hypothetical protein